MFFGWFFFQTIAKHLIYFIKPDGSCDQRQSPIPNREINFKSISHSEPNSYSLCNISTSPITHRIATWLAAAELPFRPPITPRDERGYSVELCPIIIRGSSQSLIDIASIDLMIISNPSTAIQWAPNQMSNPRASKSWVVVFFCWFFIPPVKLWLNCKREYNGSP